MSAATDAIDAVNGVIARWPVTEGPLADVLTYLQTPTDDVVPAPKKVTIKTAAPTE